MEAGFFIVVLIIIAAVAIPLSIHQAKVTNESWAHAARRLKLRHREGGWLGSPSITGDCQGFPVHVDIYTRGSGKHRQTYTRFKVRYPRHLGLGLNLTRAGFFSGLASFFGREDIDVGDARFDGDIVVQGSSPKRVIAFLTPSRRMRISRFLASYSEATITDTACRHGQSCA